MSPGFLFILLPALAAAAVFGALLAFLVFSGKLSRLRDERNRLEISLELERKAADTQQHSMQQLNSQLRDSFNALAADALKSNNLQFLRLAKENLQQYQVRAEGELEKREQAVENLVKPIREALDKTETHIRNMENERQKQYGELSQHLKTVTESQRLLQGETRNLVQALRRPEVRGQWGELTLKRLVEIAGMVEHCDFSTQHTLKTDDGSLRPDMVIHMPEQREIVVDAKTPLDAYLSAVEAEDDTERDACLARHARNVRARIKELSSKAYWDRFKFSPDFVVLFMPGDQFLNAALDIDHSLMEDALVQKVIIATPTNLIALLHVIANSWRQEILAENADTIRDIGSEMYNRLVTFAEHLAKLGRSLNSSVDAYNKATASFDSRVLPGARKFTELGISAKKDVPGIEQVEHMTRRVETREESDQTH